MVFMIRGCILTAVMVCVVGCARANLSFRDVSGEVVARGDIKLPGALPVGGGSFDGYWHLKAAREGFPIQRAEGGRYSGRVEGDEVTIDLNPDMIDNNVVLVGRAIGGMMTGRWQYSSFAGSREMGSFTVEMTGGD
jgi:hypothetical protein